MAEIDPPDSQLNGAALPPVPLLPPPDNIGTKRQRRPSVRLGDIGDQNLDSHFNRKPKQWKMPPVKPPSKVRNLSEYHQEGNNNKHGEDKEGNLDIVAIGSWKPRDSNSNPKPKRNPIVGNKRVRSNWLSKSDDNDKFSGAEDVDDGFRDFEPGGSESPLKEQSPVKRGIRSSDHQDGAEMEGPSDTDGRNWCNFERNGVRVWLNQLGLGRYAPVFEIHEVDDEVLPMLTLEDLKDMGINAVGSRRKMFSAIQKLGKGFS
jgi:hypothetical protein